mmetsp:Transcript_37549/g.77056  ORF Transcript_37549/g.77056 Transcript_37549/m.77056 type:complete len:339 (+) Transcript_37549:106-1122(+)
MPFNPRAMIAVAQTNNSQTSLHTELKAITDPTNQNDSPPANDEVPHGAACMDVSPRTQPNAFVEDKDESSTEQAAIASIILQLSQQPAKKRRVRPDKDTESPQLSQSPTTSASSERPPANENANLSAEEALPPSQPFPHTDGGAAQPDAQGEAAGKMQPRPAQPPTPTKQPEASFESTASSLALQALKQGALSKSAETRKPYRCSKCGAEKKGHVCSAKSASDSQPSGAQVVEVKRGDLAARLAARLQGNKDGSEASTETKPSAEQGGGAAEGERRGILLAATKHDLDRMPYVTSYNAVDVFNQGIINHPAIASGLPILLKCPPSGWGKVIQLPCVGL